MTDKRKFEVNEQMISIYQEVKRAHGWHPYMTPCDAEAKHEIEVAFALMFSPTEVAEAGFKIW